MITKDDILFLNQFIMNRPLDGLNLFDAQNALRILTNINKLVQENDTTETENNTESNNI